MIDAAEAKPEPEPETILMATGPDGRRWPAHPGKTLCWIDVDIPPGFIVEIQTSEGKTLQWSADKPIGPKAKFRVFDPDAPAREVEWLLPGEYRGALAREWLEAVGGQSQAPKPPGETSRRVESPTPQQQPSMFDGD